MSSADPASSQSGPKLLLSYARADSVKVMELSQRLNSDGFSVWFDQEQLKAGERWEAKIKKAIFDADAVIVCLSRESISRTGDLEKKMAVIFKAAERKPKNFIVPIRLEECPVPAILELLHFVDLFAEDGYERLLIALDHLALPASGPIVSTESSDLPTKSSAPRKAKARRSMKSGGSNATTSSAAKSSDVIATEQEEKPETEQAEAAPYPGKVLRQGSRGTEVQSLQQRLKDLGFSVPVDGMFGPATRHAIVAIQQQRGITQDGVVGPDTWAALISEEPDDQADEVPPEPGSPQSIREGLAEEARERNALNDKPVDDVTKDTLGFKDYVFALREFIASQSTTTPLTISINGAWGSGKSSLMRMLQRELEPGLARGLWWIQLKWLAGWLRGTLFCAIGKVLIKIGHRDSDYIRLGLAFEPEEDVTDDNFDQLLGKYVEYSLRKNFGTGTIDSARLEEERKQRREKTRFWARQGARRQKMRPREHPTIWFNAWKFNQQEQVWAALATAVLGQLKTKYSFLSRFLFLSELTLKRTDKLRMLNHLARKMIVPIAIAAVVAIYKIKREALRPYLPIPTLPAGWSDNLVWLAPVLAAMWQAFKAIEDPFKLPIDELVSHPDYAGKIGFIGTFEEDFGRIVDVAIRRSFFWQPRKLVIFIDDLDRCSPIQAAGIVEAINLFLDSVGCVFVLGMDMSAVAISIEVKYKELTERMRKDAPDSISPGVLFLDKIVQIPFNVPRPNKEYIDALVKKITEPQTRELPSVSSFLTDVGIHQNGAPPASGSTSGQFQPATNPVSPVRQAAPAPQPDRAGFAQEDIREAIVFAANLLKENPRQVKRFINLFRLQVYIAHERRMLSDNEFGLTPKRLAVWVAWYMQWPEVFRLLASSAQTEELYDHMADICSRIVAPPNAKDIYWRLKGPELYLSLLSKVRKRDGVTASHWSNLPWQLWTKDSDFLHCLKELERYWKQPELLESMLDMTQVTIDQKPVDAALPPPSGISDSPAVPIAQPPAPG